MNTCSVDGCRKPLRSSGADYCNMHYSRLRRHGHLNPTRPFSRTTGLCPVDGCDQPQNYNGMCKKHATRVARHGDPLTFIPHRERNLPHGPDSAKWAGSEVSYSGMHQRVRTVKGRAADHPCAECGNPAKQWSYDHADPDERPSEFGPYSTGLDHYVARCVPCHKKLDLLVAATVLPKADAPIDLEAVRQLHAEGVRVVPMSKRLGVSRGRIERALDELALPRFRPGNPHLMGRRPT